MLESTLLRLDQNEDSTATTQKQINVLKAIRNTLKIKGRLDWHQWVKIAKVKVGAKSREDVEELIEYAWTHERHPAFHA